MDKSEIRVVILTKNEESNIKKCLNSLLKQINLNQIFIYDSYSSDKTKEFVNDYGIKIISWDYISHASSYNRIILEKNNEFNYVICLDADMELSENFIDKVCNQFLPSFDYMTSSVKMYYDNMPLKFCSLYPDKPIMFRSGQDLFIETGHAEKIPNHFNGKKMTEGLYIIHNDLKDYSVFIENQLRYGDKVRSMIKSGGATKVDFIRSKFPLFGIVVFIYTYIFKGGFLDGKAGLNYSLDRLITELIWFRIISKNDH